jgi:predicted RNA-binding Zn-ribbon protein involved in translation (DUF1610 family)
VGHFKHFAHFLHNQDARMKKAPTDDEYDKFDGMHCSRKYAALKQADWTCPVCGRSLRQCIRWRKISGPYHRAKYGDANGYGFTIGLHEHHDHGERWTGCVVICGACNAADGLAKRRLGLPKNWSFSVAELRQFVTAEPHGAATIIYVHAKNIYEDANK